jgi:prefoldin alpha subunit
MNESEAQQQYQQIQQQIQQLSTYVEELDNSLEELQETQQALKTAETIEEGDKILAPIGSGVFMRAQITDDSKTITNLGGDTFEERSLEKSNNVVQERMDQIQDSIEEVEQTRKQLEAQSQQIQQQMMSQAQEENL